MANVDYSLVARPYSFIEHCVFGGKLQAARTIHLERVTNSVGVAGEVKILVVGGGDGRFLHALLRCIENAKVDYVDCSPGMLEMAKKRVSGDPRVNWHCCTLEDFEGVGYDVISGHFLLDRYEGAHRHEVVERIINKLNINGYILVSDFDSSAKGARLWMLAVMQIFFFLSARSPIVKVMKDDSALLMNNLSLVSEKVWDDGWIYSQIWKM